MNDRINTSQWQRLGALFDQAIGLDDAGQLELLGSIECDDADLAQALRSLLEADAKHRARTLEQRERVLQDSMAAIDASDVAVGDRVGPYVLREELGRGGMGVVFRAERADGQVQQEVALKIVRRALLDASGRERFLREREIGAAFEHPHIARLLDVGATESGQPYFVMELVRGEPISTYCSRNDLPIDQRLQLFGQVCAAVQHAHTKGIIHRDLKPSNVLVITQDGQPFAKVIDFGIAKVTSGRLTDRTVFTEQFLMMGTPLYMSPEQAEGSADIDTRTDIYALGVILYELLTDTTPIDSDSLRSAAYTEVQRIIREVDPPRPSVRLLQAITTNSGVAAKRGMETRALVRLVRGELDWIAMKAMEKDRDRRYETANALALDVRRHLAGEAVLAAPPGAVYQMQKFVRRNKGAVAAAMLIALSLLVGIVAFAWQARIAQHQAHLAQQRADELGKVARFEGDMLRQVDPTQAGKLLIDDIQTRFATALVRAGVSESDFAGQVAAFAAQLQRVNATDTARDLVDRTTLSPAIAAIDKQFKDQPLVAATLLQVLADRYVAIGLLDSAMPLQHSALVIRRRVLGEDHPDTLQSISRTGELLAATGRQGEAESDFREAMEKRRRVLGEEDKDTVESIGRLGAYLSKEGKLSEAEPYLREALEKSRRVNGDESAETAGLVGQMGILLQAQGKLSEAEPYLREAVEKMRRVLGEDDPDTLSYIGAMGWELRLQGKMSEAEPFLREAMEKNRRDLGEEHPRTLAAIEDVGLFLKAEGKPSEAEPYFREVLAKRQGVQGEQASDTLIAMANLGMDLVEQGKLSEAEPYLREALQNSRSALGENDPTTQYAISQMGTLLVAQGENVEAEQLLAPSEAETSKAEALSRSDARALIFMSLGKARTRLREFTAAETDLLEALATFKAGDPNDSDIGHCTKAVIDLYNTWNNAEPGKGYDAKAAEWRRKLDKLDVPTPAAAVH